MKRGNQDGWSQKKGNPRGPREQKKPSCHGGGVATGHTPTPSHSRTIFRAGGGGGGGGLGLGGRREAAKKGGGEAL